MSILHIYSILHDYLGDQSMYSDAYFLFELENWVIDQCELSRLLTVFIPCDFVDGKASVWAIQPLKLTSRQELCWCGHFPYEWQAINIDSHEGLDLAKDIIRTTRIEARGGRGRRVKVKIDAATILTSIDPCNALRPLKQTMHNTM